MKVSWLHLSDLHIGRDQYNENIVLNELISDVKTQVEEKEIALDFILITGDVTYSGQDYEFKCALDFITHLSSVTSISLENVIIVPGNHDLDRKNISFSAKNLINAIKCRDDVTAILSNDLDKSIITKPFSNYYTFLKNFGWAANLENKPLFFTINKKVNGVSISLLALNSAWLAYGYGNEKGMLMLGERQVREALEMANKPDLTITLLHHPFEWLKDFDKKDCKLLLERKVDYILTGHEHQDIFSHSWGARAYGISAGSAYSLRTYSNSYNIIINDLEHGKAQMHLRKYSDSSGMWISDNTFEPGNEKGIIDFDIQRKISKVQNNIIFDEDNITQKDNSLLSIPDLLPAMHVTCVLDFMQMLKDDRISPLHSPVFNMNLLYFSYGKPISSLALGMNSKNSNIQWLPCCLIVDTKKITPFFKVFPFDIRAYMNGLYEDIIKEKYDIEKFVIVDNDAGVQAFVKKYYLTNENYLMNIPVNSIKYQDKKGELLLSLLNSNRYFDVRSSIEIITDQEYKLSSILKAVIIPANLLDKKSTSMLLKGNIDIITYYPHNSVAPQMMNEVLFQKALEYLKKLSQKVNKTIFISYSWDSEDHKQKVQNFVYDLRAEGFHVIYDGDMKLGDRITYFMEKSVSESDIVLYICTPNYKTKADTRLGGVGYENAIISGVLYESQNENKFIPILFSGSWSESSPNWAKGKLGINMSSSESQIEEFKKLIKYLNQ